MRVGSIEKSNYQCNEHSFPAVYFDADSTTNLLGCTLKLLTVIEGLPQSSFPATFPANRSWLTAVWTMSAHSVTPTLFRLESNMINSIGVVLLACYSSWLHSPDDSWLGCIRQSQTETLWSLNKLISLVRKCDALGWTRGCQGRSPHAQR